MPIAMVMWIYFTFLGVSSPFPIINLSLCVIKHFFGLKNPKNTLNFKYDQLQKNFNLCGLKVTISKKIKYLKCLLYVVQTVLKYS